MNRIVAVIALLAAILGGCGGGGESSGAPTAPIESVSSISIDTHGITDLDKGQSVQLSPVGVTTLNNTVALNGGAWRTYTDYEVQDIASISPSGLLTRNGFGKFVVEYTYDGKRATREFGTSSSVTEINIQQPHLDAGVGESLDVMYGVFSGVSSVVKPLNWTSSDPSVATVTESGAITGISAGSAIITAFLDGNKDQTTVEVHPKLTLVGGLIEGAVIWSKENSPYQMVGDIQIAHGSTLTVDAGVEIKGNVRQVGTTYRAEHANSEPIAQRIDIWGRMQVSGTSIDLASISHVEFSQKETILSPYSSDYGEISIDYSNIENAILIYNGSLTLTNSQISNSYGPNISGTWRRPGTISIIGNTFTNHEGIEINPSLKPDFSYNVVASSVPYSVLNFRLGSIVYGGTFNFAGNSILTGEKSVKCDAQPNFSNYSLNLSGNYWGTVDTTEIDRTIWDQNDDYAFSCVVTYQPLLAAP